MSYYNRPMGDYSTGGYGFPQGDPGLLGFLGKVIPIAKKVVAMFRSPTGRAVVTAGVGAAAVEVGQRMLAPGGAGPPAPPGAGFPGVGLPSVMRGVGLTTHGVMPINGVCPVGYHLRKSDKAFCVRNRRTNVANPRALRRSIRRLRGFEKIARKTLRATKRVKS